MTKKKSQTTGKTDCATCGRQYTPACDYMQGRCPYHPAILQPLFKNYKTRFHNIFNFFKGNK